MSRIARGAVSQLRQEGKNVGLIRPITLWPFPQQVFERFKRMTGKIRFLVVEMSHGQMVEDVRLVLNGRCPVEFLGRSGGGIPTEEEIIRALRN